MLLPWSLGDSCSCCFKGLAGCFAHNLGLMLFIDHDIAGKPLCDAQLKAEIGTMIMGGFETTAHTLAFTLFCIATHPEVEATILAELQSLGLAAKQGAPQARPLEYDDLRNMPYITNVIKEAMRMFPVVAGFPRYDAAVITVGMLGFTSSFQWRVTDVLLVLSAEKLRTLQGGTARLHNRELQGTKGDLCLCAVPCSAQSPIAVEGSRHLLS